MIDSHTLYRQYLFLRMEQKKTFSRAIAELALHYNRAEQVIIRLLISEEDKINGNLEKTQPPNWKRSEKEEEISHTES